MVAEEVIVSLSGGAPWGFRLQGGAEQRKPLQVAKVRKRSKACRAGLREADELLAINELSCEELSHAQAMNLIDTGRGTLHLRVRRSPGLQSLMLLSPSSPPPMDEAYRVTLQALSPPLSSSMPPGGVGVGGLGCITSPPNSEAYYGETDSDADVAAQERQRRQKRRSPSNSPATPKPPHEEEEMSASEMSGYESAPDATSGYPGQMQMQMQMQMQQRWADLQGPPPQQQQMPGVARREVVYQPPPMTEFSGQNSGQSSPQDSQGAGEGDSGFQEPPAVKPAPLVSPERAREAMMLASRRQLVPMVGPVDMPLDEELLTTYKDKARQAKLNRGESGQEKQVKEARTKCRSIASLLTDAPNPHAKGVLMFKKRRQRAKKYTLTCFGSNDDASLSRSETEDEEEGSSFPGSESEFDEEGFTASTEPDPVWDSDYLALLDRRSSACLGGGAIDVAPENTSGLSNMSGKGAQLFEQQRQRAAKSASAPLSHMSDEQLAAMAVDAAPIPPPYPGASAPMAQGLLNGDSTVVSRTSVVLTPPGSAAGLPTMPSVGPDAADSQVGGNIHNRTARPFGAGSVTHRASTAPVVFRPTPPARKAVSVANVPAAFSSPTAPDVKRAVSSTSLYIPARPATVGGPLPVVTSPLSPRTSMASFPPPAPHPHPPHNAGPLSPPVPPQFHPPPHAAPAMPPAAPPHLHLAPHTFPSPPHPQPPPHTAPRPAPPPMHPHPPPHSAGPLSPPAPPHPHPPPHSAPVSHPPPPPPPPPAYCQPPMQPPPMNPAQGHMGPPPPFSPPTSMAASPYTPSAPPNTPYSPQEAPAYCLPPPQSMPFGPPPVPAKPCPPPYAQAGAYPPPPQHGMPPSPQNQPASPFPPPSAMPVPYSQPPAGDAMSFPQAHVSTPYMPAQPMPPSPSSQQPPAPPKVSFNPYVAVAASPQPSSTSSPQPAAAPGQEALASREQRIAVPAARTGILADARRRNTSRKPMFAAPEKKKDVTVNPALLSMVHNLDERPRGGDPGFESGPEEDSLNLGAEACNFMQSNRVGRQPAPPVAPKPSRAAMPPPPPPSLQSGGKGADLFARRQSRMDRYVVDKQQPQQYVSPAQPRDPSPTPSLPSHWKYSSNIRAPPPINYNPLLSPSCPPVAQRTPKASEPPRVAHKPGKKPVVDIMNHQPYQLNSSLFSYGGGVPQQQQQPPQGVSLTAPRQVPVKAARVYEIKRFSTPTPMSAPTSLTPKVIVPRSATTLAEPIWRSDVASPPPAPLQAPAPYMPAPAPYTPAPAPYTPAPAPYRPSPAHYAPAGPPPMAPAVSSVAMPALPHLNVAPVHGAAPYAPAPAQPYGAHFQAAKQFQSAPELSPLAFNPALRPSSTQPGRVPRPRFSTSNVGLQPNVWRPGAAIH